jgi:hypothetical protein
VTMAPERLALPALPPPAAGAELTLVPAAAPLPVTTAAPAPRTDRPHLIVAGATTAVLGLDALAWYLLRPLDQRTALVLLLVATLAASLLVGATGSLYARPLPTRKADR